MKKHYSEPEMEVIELDCRDMILTSAGCPRDLPPMCGEYACVCDAATGVPDDIDWEEDEEERK